MLKLLRKYNKIILVFGGCLLMVAFLLPQALSQLGTGSPGSVVAKVRHGSFSATDLNKSRQEYEILLRIMGYGAPTMYSILVTTNPSNPDPTEWLLRAYEAQRAGFVGGARAGRAFLERAATEEAWLQVDQLARQYSYIPRFNFEREHPQRMEQSLQRLEEARRAIINSGYPERFVDETLAKAQGVYRLMESYGRMAPISRPEAIIIGDDLLDAAIIDAMIVPATSQLDAVPDPTVEQMEAHFEQYRSVDPATDEFGIGYLRPHAVKLEYLVIDAQAVRTAVELDLVEMQKYWRNNKSRFGEAETFAEARENVEGLYRNDLVERMLQAAENVIRDEVHRNQVRLERNGPYRVLPEGWASQQLDLEALAQTVQSRVSDQFKQAFPKPEVYRQDTDWLDRPGLRGLPGIGMSSMRLNNNRMLQFPEVVMAARSLDGIDDLGIQEGLIYGPLHTGVGNMSYFRLLETRPSSPPASLSEVEEQVRQNLKRQAAYELLVEQQETYRSRAANLGLEMIAESVGAQEQTGLQVTRQAIQSQSGTAPIARINHPELRDAVMDRVDLWDPKLDIEQIPPIDRIVVQPIPSVFGLIIAKVTAHYPMTLETFRESDASITAQARFTLFSGTQKNPLSLDNLIARHDFRFVGASEEDEPDVPSPESESTAPSSEPS